MIFGFRHDRHDLVLTIPATADKRHDFVFSITSITGICLLLARVLSKPKDSSSKKLKS
jgi:hypothetical protein